MRELVKRGIVLEVCPYINLVTKAVSGIQELKIIFAAFKKHGVQFTINTDWPETVEHAHLTEQIEFLLTNGILTQHDVDECMAIARRATFTKRAGIEAYL